MHLDFVKKASMKVDAFEHLEVTHHRNLGISRTSLVMSRQVVDKELHQIQSAAETTLCGSPLLLACTEPWTSVDFRGLSDFSIKKTTQWQHVTTMTTLGLVEDHRAVRRCYAHRASVRIHSEKNAKACESESMRNIFFDFFEIFDKMLLAILQSIQGHPRPPRHVMRRFDCWRVFGVQTKLEAFSRTLPIKTASLSDHSTGCFKVGQV